MFVIPKSPSGNTRSFISPFGYLTVTTVLISLEPWNVVEVIVASVDCSSEPESRKVD